jgi:hypothetical protein
MYIIFCININLQLYMKNILSTDKYRQVCGLRRITDLV